MIAQILELINPYAWFIGNIALLYIGLLLIAFVILYQLWFDPKATTGGKMIFRFAYSLCFVIGIIVVGIFINPRNDIPWYVFSGDILSWRPLLRLAAYAYVAYTITSLVSFLWRRKFRPSTLSTAPDKDLVLPRHETSENPIIKEANHD